MEYARNFVVPGHHEWWLAPLRFDGSLGARLVALSALTSNPFRLPPDPDTLVAVVDKDTRWFQRSWFVAAVKDRGWWRFSICT
ncbi:uncharacterized protein BDV17DRAFT_272402 [Aspergillus undulatus]|uniref:uncharacterized protein n=1 Tax=Aspergillus undulatus TaxID=1810928 RepID=UPI003CCD24B4